MRHKSKKPSQVTWPTELVVLAVRLKPGEPSFSNVLAGSLALYHINSKDQAEPGNYLRAEI